MTDYNLIGNKIVEAKQHPLGYSAMELFEIPPKRFDPFKALDTIIRQITEQVADSGGYLKHTSDMLGQLYALRAYITGIEKSNES